MGANAVLMMRFDSAGFGQTMSEIVAYGTAAVIECEPVCSARATGSPVSSEQPRFGILNSGLMSFP
jgi:hypothetical protein